MGSKVCNCCVIEKPLSEFYYRENRKVYEARCKECMRKAANKYYADNKAESALKAKKYRESNRDTILKQKEEYRKKNRKLLSQKQSAYTKKRLETDNYYRLKFNLRSRIKQAIKNASVVKAGPTFDLLGCTPDDVRIFLEAEFSCTIKITKAEDSKEAKAKQALPGKPAILLK